MNVVIFGLLAVAVGLWGMSAWWWSVAEILRGLVPIMLVFIGIVALAAGVTKVRDDKTVSDEGMLKDKNDDGLGDVG